VLRWNDTLFGEADSPSCGRARVCHPANQGRIRLGRGKPSEKKIERASDATVVTRALVLIDPCGWGFECYQHDPSRWAGEGIEYKFYFCPRGIAGSADAGLADAGSADPDGAGEVGAPIVPRPSLGGNFAASLTMAAARSLLVLHAGSEMRHCASVYVHPQSQASALSLCNAAMRCS
jgi:hypothetical protein